MQVFLMFPVLLLGMVPSLQAALTKIVHGIILLNGRVISERVRRDKGYCNHTHSPHALTVSPST